MLNEKNAHFLISKKEILRWNGLLNFVNFESFEGRQCYHLVLYLKSSVVLTVKAPVV